MGMIGGTLLSVNADLGGYFYLPRDFVSGASTSQTDGSLYSGGEDDFLYTVATSSQLTCTVPRNTSYPIINCYVPNLAQGLPPSQSAWPPVAPVPIPPQSACNPFGPPLAAAANQINIAASSMCFGIAAAVWEGALVVTGATGAGARFFATYYVEQAGAGGYSFNCTFGCHAAGDLLTSAEPTFGSAVALWGDVLVVGVPGADGGRGGAALFRAAGEPDESGYGAHRDWLPAGWLATSAVPGLPNPSATGRLGSALSVGPSLLVAAAPGGGSIQGYVTVFSYDAGGPGNVTLTALCTVGRTTGAAAGSGSFGLALAQSAAGPGWTTVAVGSPDENRVYMLWVSSAGACQVRRAQFCSLGPSECICLYLLVPSRALTRRRLPAEKVAGGLKPVYGSSTSRFGAAVALATGFVYIGDPGCAPDRNKAARESRVSRSERQNLSGPSAAHLHSTTHQPRVRRCPF